MSMACGNALKQGQAADVITERIQNKRAELAEIVTQIKKEENNQVSLTEDEIKFFLTKLKRFDTTNKVNRKILVNVLVNAVYLYDDRITYVMNVGERTVEITEGLLADIRANSPLFFESSTIDELAPPYRNQSNSFVNAKEFRLIFLLKLNLYLHIIR